MSKANAKSETIYYTDSISLAPYSEHVSYHKHIYQRTSTLISRIYPSHERAMRENECVPTVAWTCAKMQLNCAARSVTHSWRTRRIFDIYVEIYNAITICTIIRNRPFLASIVAEFNKLTFNKKKLQEVI